MANKWKMLPKEAYHDHCAKAAQGSRDCPPPPPLPSLWLVGPPKTALLIYNNYLEDESIFLPRNEHDFLQQQHNELGDNEAPQRIMSKCSVADK